MENLACGVCNGESGGVFRGVACIPGAPMSIAWCSECLKRNVAPTFIFEHDFIFVAEGDIEKLNGWARIRETWCDGAYISFDEYVKRITPEQVKEALDQYQTYRQANIPQQFTEEDL